MLLMRLPAIFIRVQLGSDPIISLAPGADCSNGDKLSKSIVYRIIRNGVWTPLMLLKQAATWLKKVITA
ncbi:MAG: hypothetical protein A2Y12_05580 [Planctomycetes bacterium GWF2_42_9]|nr:MAG: hypothetical protein A2Y12_05580 [Planctomycetes bacterium GWF2_42_9]